LKPLSKNILRFAPVIALLPVVWLSGAAVLPEEKIREFSSRNKDASRSEQTLRELLNDALKPEIFQVDTPPVDTLKYPFSDNYAPQPGNDSTPSLQMQNPSNVETNVEYDPETNTYIITETVGGQNTKPPTYMTFDEYQRYVAQKQEQEYWETRSAEESQSAKKPLIPKLNINSKVLDKIFGDCPIEIKPQGSAELIFGWNTSKVNNPALPIRQRKNTTFNFDQKIQMNVTGNIGCKMKLTTSYNTEATFDFDNQMKLAYQGEEDDIIQLIEAGNVNLPLTGSLIQGSQSLFGVKTALKFGRLTVTSIFSQQRGKSQTIDVQGGAQVTKFEIKGDNYEANKHYFLAEYFRSNYDHALANLPIVSSNAIITKVEVYVTNKTSIFDNTRNIVPFQGLGENADVYSAKYPGGQTFIQNEQGGVYPFNKNNNLYSKLTSQYSGIRTINQVTSTLLSTGLQNSRDYEAIENARRLTEGSEYTVNNRLGYISLSTPLNADEVLAVAFQYTLNGTTYQVGEFSTDGIAAPNALILKMLKSTTLNTRLPMWDWMMKNVYSLGAYQLNREDFTLNILYDNFASGTRLNYLPNEAIVNPPPSDGSRILLKVMNVDKLNVNNDPVPDGYFDYVEGLTINSQTGRIFLPVVEPFGSHLRQQILAGPHPELADQFDYQILYDSTHQKAVQQPQLNRFLISGSYKSESGSEIPLNAINVPQGSVTVTAGGTTLTEGADYTVDYTLGRVKIINQSILNAGTPISINLESQSMFNIQTKTLYGTHLDYTINKNFKLGGTFMHMNERPLTQKVNIGDEPISNSIWGLDGSWRKESRLLTKLVDKIPLINTKAPSSIAVNGEFAQLLPGNAKAISQDGGISYMDDFEGTQTLIDIKNVQSWGIASTPQGQPDLFPEASLSNDLRYGMNRAKLAWYIIDPLFIQDGNQLTPDHITKDDQSNHFTRMVQVTEVFPNQQVAAGQINALTVFDMAYYPREKGPYNFDSKPLSGLVHSAGINSAGYLNDPESRWGGIMRKIDPNDFEAANIQFVQFWMMDPFALADGTNPINTTGGDFYINLGNTSEDILRDSRKAFENGLPAPTNGNATDTTAWGIVPNVQQIVNAFDNDPASRPYQDIGLDGLADTAENTFFKQQYLDEVVTLYGMNSEAYTNAITDPSSDDYTFYRNADYDAEQRSILWRYKKYNNLEGNSPASESANESFPTSATTVPNAEDVNKDNTLSESETYYQYKISLRPQDMVVGENYITDKITVTPPLLNGETHPVTWYQFRVPVRQPDRVVGSISDFRSIRFMRLFMRGFEDSVVCRFAKMELVRGEWRPYDFSLLEPGEYVPVDNSDDTEFNVGAVNIEQNSNRIPINYKLPPGIQRQQINQGNSNTLRQLNEQSLSLRVCGLNDGDARAAFKNVQFDVRRYKRFKMFVHAEQRGEEIVNDGDLTCFIRFGTDYVNNYYEYEIPLKFTPLGDPDIDSTKIWPDSNFFDFPFEVLLAAKQERTANGVPQIQPFYTFDPEKPDNRITIVGNPNLANVRTAMIGIRNPPKAANPHADDGKEKCAEIWVNEMRLTDFNNESGSAARLQAKITLADFATVNIGTGLHTFGWGQVQEKLNQRSWTDSIGYDIATTVALDKFIPQKIGVKLPMFYSISESFSNPNYNPLNPDIELKNENDSTRKAVKEIAQGYVKRQSLNFSNVMRMRGKGIGFPTPIDISNFSATYAYTEMESRDINYELNNDKSHRGSLNYAYNPNPKNVRPFAKLKIMKKISDSIIEHKKKKEKDAKAIVDSLKKDNKKPSALKEAEDELALRTKRKDRFVKASDRYFKSGYLKPIKDFNFNYLPSNFGVRNDVIRDYAEQKLRNTTTDDLIIDATYNKSFLWNRYYTFKYDLTKALKIDFTATNNARIDEPQGKVDKDDEARYDYWKDSVWRNVQNGGRTTMYQHATNVTYTLPINKLPIFDFVNANVGYSSTYMWNAASLAALSLGNTISNSNTKTGNVNLNFTQLYNKVKYFKRAGQPQSNKPAPKPKPKDPKAPIPDSLKTPKDPPKILDGIGITFSRLLIAVKNASFTYNQTNGTVLPGYRPQTDYMGMDFGDRMAPGWDYIFGSQKDIRYRARDNNWLSQSDIVSGQYITTKAITWNGRATVEPLPNLKVDLTMNYSETENHSEFFQWIDTLQDFRSNSPMTNGSYSVSWNTFGTAFEGNSDDYTSAAFEQLRANRKPIADRIAAINGSPGVNSEGFPIGYTQTSQDVLIPAFLAAYSKTDVNKIGLSPFPAMPKVNWSAKYDGLGKLPFMKKIFKSIVFSHAYRSTYAVSSWMTNLNYNAANNGLDSSQNFIPPKTIQTITISEQFSPFIGIDFTFNNSLIAKFELKKSRTLSLSMVNTQVTEIKSEEWVMGLGYRFKNVKFPFKLAKGKKKPVSDVNTRVDLSIRDNRTIIRKIEDDVNQPTAGQKLITIKFSADYVLSPRFNIRAFYDRIITKPVISSSFPTDNTNAGIALRFTLAQ
jgi:cell surface protein SprA